MPLHDGSEFKTQVQYITRAHLPVGELGTSTQTIFSFGFFSWIFFPHGDWSLRTGPPPSLGWNSFLPLVTTVLITPKGAESPDSRRVGVIGLLVLILPSETVWDKFSSP